MNIKLRVARLIKRHGSCHPMAIAEDLGVKVIYADLPSQVRGFLVRVLRRKFIFINRDLSEQAAVIVAAHELGHARLHAGYGFQYHAQGTVFVSSTKEKEANEFAAHLLSYSYDVDPVLVSQFLQMKRPDPKIVHQILREMVEG